MLSAAGEGEQARASHLAMQGGERRAETLDARLQDVLQGQHAALLCKGLGLAEFGGVDAGTLGEKAHTELPPLHHAGECAAYFSLVLEPVACKENEVVEVACEAKYGKE